MKFRVSPELDDVIIEAVAFGIEMRSRTSRPFQVTIIVVQSHCAEFRQLKLASTKN